MNHLYFGDCLDVLKQLKDENPQPFIDLIYIDPPFNSKRNYNVLFESMDMKDATAQKEAFADTWSNYSYMETLHEIATLDRELYTVLNTFHELKSISDSAVAYLTTMAIRIWYMHKLLKDTGSFYLHCDPTMSHYLKLMCDMIFGERNFRSEIIWRRTNAHNKLNKQYGPIHDTIFFYAKSLKCKFHPGKRPYNKTYIDSRFKYSDEHGRYQTNYLTGPGARNGDSGKEWKGFNPTSVNRHWAIPDSLKQFLPSESEDWIPQQKLDYFFSKGLILFPKKENGQPMYKQYIGGGVPYQDIWAYQPNTDGSLYNTDESIDEDVKYLENEPEILGYPTQKPVGLLKRIIETSTNENDIVADFFCGCGSTIDAAQMMQRKWLGVDISHLAIRLIQKRLIDTYGLGIKETIKLHGLPKDIASARMLAEETEKGRIRFQDWAIEVMLNGVVNERKVADGGFDGYIVFNSNAGKQFALIETKSGHVNVKNLREFVRVIDSQKAAVGIFVCFEETLTREMTKEAKNAGHIKIDNVEFAQDKIQILTVEDLFNGKQPQLPFNTDNTTFKKAQRNEGKSVSKGLFD